MTVGTDLGAVILVGGKGTRLREVVADRPKPMAIVCGRPFVEWIVLALRQQKVKRVIFSTGFMAETVHTYFGDGKKWSMEISYSHEDEPLGTAGAVRLALDQVHSNEFLVMNGDSFCSFDVDRLMNVHYSSNACGTLWLTHVPDCSRYGSVVLRNDGTVGSFSEKEPGKGEGVINAGIYVLNRKLISSIPCDMSVSLEKDVLPTLIGRGLYGVVGEGDFLDIGTPEDYKRADTFPAWSALAS